MIMSAESKLSKALHDAIAKHKIRYSDLARLAGLDRNQIRLFVTDERDMHYSNVEKLVFALPPAVRAEVINQVYFFDPGSLANFINEWRLERKMGTLELELLVQANTTGFLSTEEFREIMAGRIPVDRELAFLSMVITKDDGPYSWQFWEELRDASKTYRSIG